MEVEMFDDNAWLGGYRELMGECEQEQEPRSGLHPLLIDHIIQKVLETVDPELLGHHCKVFRLVCKDWCRVATRVYRQSRGRITFKKNFIGRVTELFIRSMRTSADIPFDKFRFSADSYDDEHFGDLLHECSGAIAHLDLLMSNPCDLKFPKDFQDLTLGKLNTLILHVRIDCQGDPQPEMPTLLVSLLRGSPNLRKLELKIFGGIPKTQQMINLKHQLVKNFGNALIEHFPPSVKEVKLNMTLTDEQLLKLSERVIGILSLDVYFQQSVFRAETLQYFLECVAPTLLYCKAIGTQFLADLKFPIFPRVQHLVGLGRPPGKLEYRHIFPKCNKLEICLWDHDQQDIVFPNNCASDIVQEIQFPYAMVQSSVIQRIGRCFQNLKILKNITVSTFEAMSTIFDRLTNLTELDLFLGMEFHELGRGGLAVDSAFTGFPPGMCEWLLRHKEFSGSKLINEFDEKPSLRRLKNLKHLRLSACHMRSASTIRMTDITAYFGFLQMENLEKLHLDYFPISDKVMDILENKFQVTRPC